MEKPYAVVRFIDECGSYSEIPTNWIIQQSYSGKGATCKWPPQIIKNISFLMKHRSTPSNNWPTYKVEIIGYYDTLSDARRAAEESEYSSATEKPLGRGKRIKKPTRAAAAAAIAAANRRGSSDSESSGDEISHKRIKTAIPMPAMLSDHCPTNEDPIDNEELLAQLLSDSDISTCQQEESIFELSEPAEIINEDPLQTDTVCEGDLIELFRNVKNISDNVNALLTTVGAIAVDIKDLKERQAALSGELNANVNRDILDNIRKKLPLATQKSVSDFESKLSTYKIYHETFVRFIKQVGGINGEDYTKRVLQAIFSPQFAKDNTWEGKVTKFKVKNLKIMQICEDVILDKFPTWDRTAFSKVGSNWFRLGNQRASKRNAQ